MNNFGGNPLKRLREVSSMAGIAGKKKGAAGRSTGGRVSGRQESEKQDSKKQDSRKTDSSKQGAGEQDIRKKETGKAGIKKQDILKADVRKQNSKKADAGKRDSKTADAKKQDVRKADAGKQDIMKMNVRKQTGKSADVKKQDNRKADVKKQETAKPDNRKADAKKQDTGKTRSGDQDSSRQTGLTEGRKHRAAAQTESSAASDKPTQSAPAAAAVANSAGKRRRSPVKVDLAAEKGETVRIIPLGGLEQIGLNITAFEYGDSIIVVDCGIAFPTDEMLGIDCVIPDVTYLKDNISKVKAFFITHGHEDHIGALPYILREINLPVYGTKLTIALIEHKLRENGLLDSAKLRTVKHGDCIKAGDFRVEFVKTNHSISDASALAIFTPAGTIFHTGDFKIDYTPIYGEPADLQRMAEIGNMGCLALMCDSTNAFKEGSTASEKTVGKRIDTIFAEHPDSRIIAASFASNVDRVQQFVNVADKYGRKVVVEGRSMEQIIEVAGSLGYLKIPAGTLINIDQLKNYQPKDTVIITTGSQGESMAALSRMASGTHKKVVLGEGDVVVMSSKTIPGNEKAVARVINDLYMKGVDVILHDTHVSGHACQEDLKLIYALLKPKYVVPVHGEYMHLVAQKELALSMGIPKQNICIMSSGDVLEVGESRFKVTGHVEAGPVMVEGLSIGDVGNVVLKDRQNLAQNGIIVVSMAVQQGTGELVGGPELITRGFIYEKENEDLIDELEQMVYDKAESLTGEGTDLNRLINDTRDILKSHLWKTIKRTPVILVNVLQVNV